LTIEEFRLTIENQQSAVSSQQSALSQVLDVPAKDQSPINHHSEIAFLCASMVQPVAASRSFGRANRASAARASSG